MAALLAQMKPDQLTAPSAWREALDKDKEHNFARMAGQIVAKPDHAVDRVDAMSFMASTFR